MFDTRRCPSHSGGGSFIDCCHRTDWILVRCAVKLSGTEGDVYFYYVSIGAMEAYGDKCGVVQFSESLHGISQRLSRLTGII